MLLLSTLNATQAFLDDIIIRPASLLRYMNIVEWTQLITAVITLARLARLRPEQTRETGIDHLQIKMQVQAYILTLGKRMTDLGIGNVEADASHLFSWFKAIAQGIKLWVSSSEECTGRDQAKLERLSHLMENPATSAFETVKSLTFHVESSHEKSGLNVAPTDNQNTNDTIEAAHTSGNAVMLEDKSWDIFISNWPDMTVPSGVWGHDQRECAAVDMFQTC